MTKACSDYKGPCNFSKKKKNAINRQKNLKVQGQDIKMNYHICYTMRALTQTFAKTFLHHLLSATGLQRPKL